MGMLSDASDFNAEHEICHEDAVFCGLANALMPRGP